MLLELEKILQTCLQMYGVLALVVDARNKLLVRTVELAQGSLKTAQTKAIDGMEVWRGLVDEPEEEVEEADQSMDIDG
jgi:hypothetical protein